MALYLLKLLLLICIIYCKDFPNFSFVFVFIFSRKLPPQLSYLFWGKRGVISLHLNTHAKNFKKNLTELHLCPLELWSVKWCHSDAWRSLFLRGELKSNRVWKGGSGTLNILGKGKYFTTGWFWISQKKTWLGHSEKTVFW